MAEEQLKFVVGADTSQFNAELQKAENELKQFQAALKKTTDVNALEVLNGKIIKTQQTIAGLNNSMKSVAPSTNKATQSITDLSRVVQDAPYGFIGIANNINPLVESFGRLKAESGSVGGALKSLLSGLSGPAGLGIAFAVVTSAISFAQMGLSMWTRGSKEAKDNSDDFKSKLQELDKELKYVTQDLSDFIKVAEEANKLNDINIVARFSDETTQGVLQRQSKFITISEELVKATEARSKAYENYINIARGAFKTDEDYDSARKSALDVYNETIKKENELISARQLQAATNRAATEEDKRAAAEKLKELDSIAKTLAKLKEDLRDQRGLALAFNTSTLQEQFNLVKAAITKLITDFNVDPKGELILRLKYDAALLSMQLKRELAKEEALLPLSLEFKGDPMKSLVPSKTAEAVKRYLDKVAADAKAAAQQKLAAFQGIIVSFAQDSAAQIGELLGAGLYAAISGQTNGLRQAFAGLFNLFGDAVISLGKYAIAYSSAIVALKKAIQSAGITGIGVGIGLIALGALIKAAANGIGKAGAFAVGTRYAPGGMALVGERGPEMINLPRGSQVIPAAQTSQMMGGIGGAIEVFGMLRGQDIYFSNKKYGQTYKRTT